MRKRTANAVETKTIERTAETAADNAALAADLKRRLLMRLQRIEAKYPFDATEVRVPEGKNTVIFRIRDLTGAYKDITEGKATEAESGTLEKLDKLLEEAWNAAHTETS